MRGCRNNRPEIEQFIAARINHTGGCHLWEGFTTAAGYGYMNIGGAAFAVRRVTWWLKYGYLPQGKYMKDTCFRKLCCNPEHLTDATPENERRDTLYKPGKSFNSPFLPPKDIEYIWEQVLLGQTTIYKAAKRMGVSWGTLKKHLKRYDSKL